MPSGSLVQFPLEEEYKKDTGIGPKDVENLRTWLNTQPHLPGDYVTDLELILAYHCCDRNLEATKQLIDTHFTLKTNFTDLFKDRVVDASIERVLNIMYLQPLPTRTKEGYAVYFSRFLDCDVQKFVHVDTLRALIMSWEIWQYEEGTWPGLVIISDLAGMNFGHFYRIQWSALQHYSSFLQEAFLAKLKQIHILNAPGFFDKLMAMCRPFVKKSLVDMVHIHTVDSSSLNEFYPVDALPIEAGGKWRSVEECKEEVLAKFRASTKFFEEESKKRVVEARRPGKKNAGFFGGLLGSFR